MLKTVSFLRHLYNINQFDYSHFKGIGIEDNYYLYFPANILE